MLKVKTEPVPAASVAAMIRINKKISAYMLLPAALFYAFYVVAALMWVK